jgi:hypothetical protein
MEKANTEAEEHSDSEESQQLWDESDEGEQEESEEEGGSLILIIPFLQALWAMEEVILNLKVLTN